MRVIKNHEGERGLKGMACENHDIKFITPNSKWCARSRGEGRAGSRTAEPFRQRCSPARRAALVRATLLPATPCAAESVVVAGWLAAALTPVCVCAERLATPRNKGYASVAVADEVRRALLCSCVACACTTCSPAHLRLHRLQPQLPAILQAAWVTQPRSLPAQEELGIIDEQLRSDGWCAFPPPLLQVAHANALIARACTQ